MTLEFLSAKEGISLALEELYHMFGYTKYKVNRFEEYSFYMEQANFLSDKRLLTFTDAHGKLMALKPDITMGIVKNSLKSQEPRHKIYYNESVFRIPQGEDEFKEIHQVGVEYIGEPSEYQILEMLNLVVRGLEFISEDYRLCVSNTALLLLLLEELKVNPQQKEQIILYLSQKNSHDLQKYLKEEGFSPEGRKALEALQNLPVMMTDGISVMRILFTGSRYEKALNEFLVTLKNLQQIIPEDNLHLDFSHIPSTEYYQGLVFSGYIEGLAMPVLSGGRYDKLIQQMGSDKECALGFAVDLSAVEKLFPTKVQETLDIPDNDTPVAMLQKVNEQYRQGKRCMVQSSQREGKKC